MLCVFSGNSCVSRTEWVPALKAFAYAAFVSFLPGLAAASGQPPAPVTSVPFVGCASDGQVGPLAAPKGTTHPVHLAPALAARLAWYKAEEGPGILAPHGWQCFSTYGSNGSSLFVSPEPMDPKQFFSDTWHGFTGPVIQSSSMVGDTSGRFSVARTIARVFPAHRQFLENVIAEGIEPASHFPTGPYTQDTLHYQSKELVEFTTPANTDGLGTDSRLLKTSSPIHGLAMLAGNTPDCLTVALRLQPGQDDLIPAILAQAERDFAVSEKP